jgi:hypothetical protein
MPLVALKLHIHKALETLKTEEVRTKSNYKQRWPYDTGTFDLLPELQRIRNKRVKLEVALKIIEEYE